jgi:SNF2 family DNA or RNA helicase
MPEVTRLHVGNYWLPVELEFKGGLIYFKSRYHKGLIDEIKSMDGAKWIPETKVWSVKASNRNIFQLEYLEGLNPYKKYEDALLDVTPKRTLYNHQVVGLQHFITRKECIYAAEMGCGKTLVAIEAMEASMRHDGAINWVWVGPRSAINAVKLEFKKWKALIEPEFVTYSSLKSFVQALQYVPHGVVFDECSRIKNPTAQRSVAAFDLSELVRDKKGYIFLMSGSPAPRNPCDWWHLCETACPGFLREGNVMKFKNRLAVIENRESISGGVYPHLVTWLDNENLCKKCGRLREDPVHNIANMVAGDTIYHRWEPSRNEVKYLGERMRGLVVVQFKKECLDLPDKIYRTIRCEINQSTKRVMDVIIKTAPRAITALTLLRELSDGFQYKEKETDRTIECPQCRGVGTIESVDIPKCEQAGIDYKNPTVPIPMCVITCPKCTGTKQTKAIERVTEYIKTPKEDALKDVIDEHEEVGRLVIYAGFTGSIDKIVAIVQSMNWKWIRIDGRGWVTNVTKEDGTLIKESEMLEAFQDKLDEYPQLAIIAHPESGGMGMTLTASPTIVFYSNDFKAENRIQAEDRIHRPGMDMQKGATIIDIVHLPTDEYVLANLQKKRDLQALSMEELKTYIG